MCAVDSDMLHSMLDIPGIETQKISFDHENGITIQVASTVNGTACHMCGRHICKPRSYGFQVKLRHVSILGHKTYIVTTPLRYECEHCPGNPTTTQKVNWYEQRHSCTKAYEDHLLLSLVNNTVQDVSIKEDIGYDVVEGVLRGTGTKVNWEEISALGNLGIDEISIKKGHKDFVVIITAIINGQLRILAVLENREKATVKEFFKSIPKRLRKTVRVICSDLYKGFISAAKEVFGKKILVTADRFHVAKLYRGKLDNLRKKEMGRLKKELSELEYKKLHNAMWILRKSPSDLTSDELRILSLLFKHSPLLKLAYDLCLDLTKIFDMNITQGQAKRKMHGWIRRVRNSKLTCFDTFIKTLSNHMQEITNYFVERLNSGFVEGLNNKIKVLKRRCYGLTNVTHLFQRIRLDLEGYSILSRKIKMLPV